MNFIIGRFMSRVSAYAVAGIGIAAILLIAYLPYFLHGGFIVDDWGPVANAVLHPGFLENVKIFFGLFSNRPLAPIVISFFTNIFKDHPAGYIVVNTFIWFSAVLVCAKIFAPYTDAVFGAIFILLAAVPAIASSAIFSPVNQLTNTSSMLLWSLSFYFISRFAVSRRRIFISFPFVR